jgi:hypothetical protein
VNLARHPHHNWTDLPSISLQAIKKRSHVSIWKWVQEYSPFGDRFKVKENLVKEIFVDETLIQINCENYWLWVAFEPKINSCLLFHLSRERTYLSLVSSLSSLEIGLETSLFQMTAFFGIMMHVNG